MYAQTNSSPDILNCFVQKQDTVVIPPLTDPQLQNAAFSVIEAAKSQLSELKLADLYSQQLQGEKRSQFISEFLYHWAGVDSKPPESMVESSKKNLHSMIHSFISTHEVDPTTLIDIICPVLPYITNLNEVEELSSYLTRTIYSGTAAPEEGADLVDLATLGTVISEVSLNTTSSEHNDALQELQERKHKDIQNAFKLCLTLPGEESSAAQESTTRGIFGSESQRTRDSDTDVEESH